MTWTCRFGGTQFNPLHHLEFSYSKNHLDLTVTLVSENVCYGIYLLSPWDNWIPQGSLGLGKEEEP